ncbi:hypothetical protein [Arcobacter sp. LA11]|uniref:hypothetical protein n=1 Tax=Arcobacter sp. LA11 TaxID=1898176 RepID=UPI0009338718|nr:hypothetical protein [Arcobacter sp. LA11]
MLLKKVTLTISLGLLLSIPLQAAPSINDMQSCQGLLDFIDKKLDKAPAKYSTEDIKNIREGLKGYNEYIQEEIVTPGLIKFNNGDSSKASMMQKQVDMYKLSLVNAYEKKYPANRLYTDYAVAVNNCAKKAVPKGASLEKLKISLNTIIKLAKMN